MALDKESGSAHHCCSLPRARNRNGEYGAVLVGCHFLLPGVQYDIVFVFKHLKKGHILLPRKSFFSLLTTLKEHNPNTKINKKATSLFRFFCCSYIILLYIYLIHSSIY